MWDWRETHHLRKHPYEDVNNKKPNRRNKQRKSSNHRIQTQKNMQNHFPKDMLPSRELTYPPDKAYLKMIFLFPRWDMLISWRVLLLPKENNTQKHPPCGLATLKPSFDEIFGRIFGAPDYNQHSNDESTSQKSGRKPTGLTRLSCLSRWVATQFFVIFQP